MRFLSFIFICLLVSISNGYELQERDAVTAPNCATTCLSTYIPKFCGSITNVTCACTNTNLTAAVTACAIQSCNVVELLQLQQYSAVSCGVKNDKSHKEMVLRIDYVIPVLTFCFLGGRIFGRILLGVRLGSDDWVMMASFVCYLSAVGASLGLVLHGFGEHIFWLTKYQITTALKYFYVVELFYILSNTLTKLSLLLFFLRIFPNRQFRIQVQIVSAFVVITGLALIISLVLQCAPIHGYWTNWYLPEASRTKCIDQYAALYAASGLSILQNIIILLLPVPTLWGLELNCRKRVNVLVMFSFASGVLVFSLMRYFENCPVFSIVLGVEVLTNVLASATERKMCFNPLPSLGRLKGGTDLSYNQAPIIVYSHLEQAFGIICASLPSCRCLLEYFFPALKIKLDESRSECCSANGCKIDTCGDQNVIMRSRRNTSAMSLVTLGNRDVDVEASAGVENRDKDSLHILGSGEHGMSTVAIGVAQTTDEYDDGAQEKESRVESRHPERTSSKSESVIIRTITVEQSIELTEAGKLGHESENGMGKKS